MNKERLLRVIEAVKDRPANRFHMQAWRQDGPCGSVCCAVGSYVEANPRCGLRMKREVGYTADVLLMRGRGVIDFYAAAVHFDIEFDQAINLFSEDSYDHSPTRRAVIARIRQFIRDHEGEVSNVR